MNIKLKAIASARKKNIIDSKNVSYRVLDSYVKPSTFDENQTTPSLDAIEQIFIKESAIFE